MEYKIYPEINVETRIEDMFGFTEHIHVIMKTKLRVFHKGLWYYVPFIRRFHCETPLSIAENTSLLNSDVYMFLNLGVFDENAVSQDGKKLYELCEDQTDEAERLKKEYKL